MEQVAPLPNFSSPWPGLLLLLCLPLCLPAQSPCLYGQVTIAEAGKPVADATIFLQELNELRTTDRRGHYRFDGLPAGEVTVVLFAEGFSSITEQVVVPADGLEFNISLDSLMVTTETIEIQAIADGGAFGLRRLHNVEGTAIYAAKKSEVIELDRVLGNLATNNAREVYKGVAGLNIWENDGAGLQLAIGARGLDPNRTSNFNTRQNGYDISADALGYPESYYTPPTQALHRIEIVRGAASLQYGTQFGGLLNFVFRKGPRDKAFEFVSENTAGSFGFLNTFNSIGGTKGKANYYAFYQYKRGDGWRANSGFEQHTAFANVDLEVSPDLQLGFEFTHMNYLAQQPGGLMDFEFQQDPRQSKRARNWFRVNWNLGAFNLDYRLSDRTRLNSRSFVLLAQRDALGELGPINRPDPMRERDLIAGQYRNFGNETRLIHRYDIKDNIATFLIGVRYYQGLTTNRQGDANAGSGPDFEFLNAEEPEKSDYEFPSRNVALFAENLFNIGPRLTLTPGARFEYIRTASDGYYKQRIYAGDQLIFERKFEDARLNERSFFLFGLGVGYRLNDHVELYGNVSQNYRSINFSDLAVVNPNLVVDSLLRDENGFNADLGLRGTLAGGRLRFDLSLFHLRYSDRIGIAEITVPDPVVVERVVNFRTNIGDARILGLEAYAEADLWRMLAGEHSPFSLALFTNFSALHGRYLTGRPQFAGNAVELIPPFSIKGGFTFGYRDFRASYQVTHVKEHFSDATNATFVIDATRGIIPTYTVMDASLSYEIGRFRLQTGVNNLGNAPYFTRRATGYPGPGIIPADGRSFYGTVRVRF